ncbi:MAG TPA: hypothetical protein DDW54_03300 [Clostridiales bacterium]|nr:hypothetical protein [Clostridiales bacterium]
MLDFIINPKASRGKAKKIAKKLEKILVSKGVEYAFHYSDSAENTTELARKLSETATDIIVVGGDGTVNRAFNGLNAEKVNFGIIAAGSGNDFIESAKIPRNPAKALDVILSGNAKPTDYMVCDGVRGLNIIGTGIDVEILKRCAKFRILRGKLQYLVSLIISLIKFRFYDFTVVEDGKEIPKNALIACVCNGKQFGGSIKMCPVADISDGALDFVVCGNLKKRSVPRAFIKLMRGKVLEQKFTEAVKTERARVEFKNPVTIQIDGELYDGLSFDVSIVKGGVKLYRP